MTYVPSTVTYSEIVGGNKYTYTVTSAPQPLFMGLPFDPAADNAVVVDATSSLCASDGTGFIQTSDPSSPEAEFIYLAHATVSPGGEADEAISLSPDPSDFSDSAPPSLAELGTIDPVVTPTLATTGVDPTPAGLFGTGLAILGAGAVVTTSLRRRRSRRV